MSCQPIVIYNARLPAKAGENFHCFVYSLGQGMRKSRIPCRFFVSCDIFFTKALD